MVKKFSRKSCLCFVSSYWWKWRR